MANVAKMNFRIEGRAKPHPKYNDANYENDIAIVKLDKEINFKDFSGTVTPVCLARYNGRYQSRTRTSKQCEFYTFLGKSFDQSGLSEWFHTAREGALGQN